MENLQKRKEVIQSRLNELDRTIAQSQNRQMAIKILMNSLFGAIGLSEIVTIGILI